MRPQRGHLRLKSTDRPEVFRVAEVLVVVDGHVHEEHDVFEGDMAACQQFMDDCFWRLKRAFIVLAAGAAIVVVAPVLFLFSFLLFDTSLYPRWWAMGIQWLGILVMLAGLIMALRERTLPTLEPDNVIDLRSHDDERNNW